MTPEHLQQLNLESIFDSLIPYHEVYCNHCDFSHRRWTTDEVKILGRVHEQQNDGHVTMHQAVILTNDTMPELGLLND